MMERPATAACALLVVWLVAATAAAAAVVTPAASFSKLWGRNGERWTPTGNLPDFSFAGYKQRAVDEPPSPPVTRNVTDWRSAGDDTAMLKAALAWAHKQPVTNDWIVLALPAGKLTLTTPVYIRRSKLVLRGAGVDKTVLNIPKSLTDLFGPGPNPSKPGYPFTGGFIVFEGKVNLGNAVAKVVKPAKKGDRVVIVDSAAGLVVGQFFQLWFQDVNGKLNRLMFNNLYDPPAKYKNSLRTQLNVKITAINGNAVTLERYLPYDIRPGVSLGTFYKVSGQVEDSGVEELTMSFRWQLYAGHHLEKGWHGVWLLGTANSWVRNIATVNADNGVIMSGCTGITVSGLRMSVTKTRRNKIPNKWRESADVDGHWGVQVGRSYDCLVERVDTRCLMQHDVGSDAAAKWNVFMDSTMLNDGNLDLHRGLSGPSLYTNMNVGRGNQALWSGGPGASGANACAGTTWWNIRSTQPIDPPKSNGPAGSCNFGQGINLVMLRLTPNTVGKLCNSWSYEGSVSGPPNIYVAQLNRRRSLAAAAANQTAPLA